MWTELVGWVASAILLATLVTQVVKQWGDRTSQGISPWLFAGQIAASVGFTVYSVLLGNLVFAVTNGLILASAIVGQWLYWRNRRGPRRGRKGGALRQAIATLSGRA